MNREKLQKLGFGVFLAAFFIFLIAFNRSLTFREPGDIKADVEYEKAQAVRILSDTLAPDPEFPGVKIGVQKIEFRLLTGSEAGKTVTANNFVSRTENNPAKVGTKMLLASYDGFATCTVENYIREPVVYALILAFALLVVLVGRGSGARSLFSLVFTLANVVWLFIPLIIRGAPPVLASMLVVVLSSAVMLIFITGFSQKTFVAAVSCILCTCAAGLIAYLVGAVGHVSSLNTPQAEDLIFVAQQTPLKIHDLLFAGILISSLGAVLDTAVSITSAIYEMRELNPGISAKQLLKSGMNVGKDTMGTMTNTLILAFAGSGINLFVIYYMYKLPYVQLINLDLLVIEFIQGLSGSIAVVLSIPLSAALASRIFTRISPKNRRPG